MLAIARSNSFDINWGRVFMYTALLFAAMMFYIEPAFAQNQGGAFGTFQNTITSRTREAFQTGRTILWVAAALSLLIGVAPMLWGQVKVKWIVSCLCAAVVFAVLPVLIDAFAGGGVTNIN